MTFSKQILRLVSQKFDCNKMTTSLMVIFKPGLLRPCQVGPYSKARLSLDIGWAVQYSFLYLSFPVNFLSGAFVNVGKK